MKPYLKEILDVIESTRKGMALTWKHAWDARKKRTQHNIQDTAYFTQTTGIATLEYPHVEIPVPDNGRYQLHNEMDDCIVCDKCVKVCPVDCIEIEPIKATGLVGLTSDGSPIRLYAAKFDIDMSKCCFCGLCTTVCPTECLTMTSEYDFSVFEVKEHNFSFANLTAEEAEEKKRLYEQFVAEKEEMKKSEVASPESEIASPEVKKPVFKPSFKAKTADSSQSSVVSGQSSVVSGESSVVSGQSSIDSPEVKKPVFKPIFKAKTADSSQSSVVSGQSSVVSSQSSVVSGESSVVSGQSSIDSQESEGLTSSVQSPASNSSPESSVASPEEKKPVFKPSFKAKAKDLSPTSDVQRPASNESDVQRLTSDVKKEPEDPASSSSPASNESDVQRPTSNP